MTKDEKRHLSMVAEFGCIVCESLGFEGTPAEIHHTRFSVGAAQRASHYHVIPLCPHHHRTGGHGEAFHAGKKAWEKKFGTEESFLNEITQRCYSRGST